MKCHSCGKEDAVINIRQIIGSEIKDISLCKSCAEARGILGPDNKIELSLTQILNGLLESKTAAEKPDTQECPGCGLKVLDVAKEGRMGCPECANSFHREIRKFLGKNGIEPQHKGRLPRSLQTLKTLLFDREILKNELNSALESEDYESAARIRDQIRKLEETSGVVHE